MDTELKRLRELAGRLEDRVSKLEWERDDPLRQESRRSIEQRLSSLEEDRKRIWLAGWGVAFMVLAGLFTAVRAKLQAMLLP